MKFAATALLSLVCALSAEIDNDSTELRGLHPQVNHYPGDCNDEFHLSEDDKLRASKAEKRVEIGSPYWNTCVAIAVACTLFAGLMSGLNIGVLSVPERNLELRTVDPNCPEEDK